MGEKATKDHNVRPQAHIQLLTDLFCIMFELKPDYEYFLQVERKYKLILSKMLMAKGSKNISYSLKN